MPTNRLGRPAFFTTANFALFGPSPAAALLASPCRYFPSLQLRRMFIALSTPADPSQKLRGPEMGAWDVLSFFKPSVIPTTCLVLTHLLYDHAAASVNSTDSARQAAVPANLLNGNCASTPSTPRKLLTNDNPSSSPCVFATVGYLSISMDNDRVAHPSDTSFPP